MSHLQLKQLLGFMICIMISSEVKINTSYDISICINHLEYVLAVESK
jgi:hypothetical protein